MFLDGHQLHRVVSQIADAGKNIVSELAVSSDTFFVLAHADVSFINQRGMRGGRHKIPVRPCKGLIRRPDLGAEQLGILVHADFCAVCRQPFHPVVALTHQQFIILPVLQGVLPVQGNFPYAVFAPVQRMTVPAPFIKVAEKTDLIRSGQPFPEDPSFRRTMKTEVEVAVGKVRQSICCSGQLIPFFLESVHPQFDIARVRSQPGVDLCDLIGSIHFADIHSFLLRFYFSMLICVPFRS